ncbi:MAG: nucleotidyl transferase AbiEii/AbiGii toxin family protein [Deltaproteobacteria bacterium]|nr:nucleotidyl transferase AbiEii/AbiGii toxin family protein [Deltaproteobacteria bacterium]
MESTQKPKIELAKKILPGPLFQSLEHIFKQDTQNSTVLVGGTALSGFYSGHRRSDDIDLFTRNEMAQKATVLACKSLSAIGVQFYDEFQTAQFYKTLCDFRNHKFTIDVVCDPHFFELAQFIILENGICIADLKTILMTKASTLVSRCSEKDLYDLLWLFEHYNQLNISELVSLGEKIDAGVNGETMLLSISGTKLRESACNFSLLPNATAHNIYQDLLTFQKELIYELENYLKKLSPKPLKELIKKIKNLK